MTLDSFDDKLNYMQALMHLVKAYVGTGVLAMPKAFSYSGIIVGIFGTPIIGILCNTCIHMLIDVNKQLCRTLDCEPLDYENLAVNTVSNGPKRMRKYTNVTRYAVIMFLVFAQMGFCCSYCLFWAENLRKFMMNVHAFPSASMSIQYYLLIILPLIILINFNKSIKLLSIASSLANLIQLTCFGIILYNLVQNVPSLSQRKSIGTELPLYFSTTMFSFEGITVTMPLYRAMKNPDQFSRRFGVVNISLVVVVTLYTLIGGLGYLKYGDSIASVLTLSLPNEPLYNSLEIMYPIVLCVSYPIQMYVAINQLWPSVENQLIERKFRSSIVWLSSYVFRALLVSITFALAAFIPRLDLVISLIGAVSGSSIAIIIPSILHTIIIWDSDMIRWRKCATIGRNAIIFVFGVIGFSLGTYFSVKDIVAIFH